MILKLSLKKFKKCKFLLIDDFERDLFNNKKIEVFSLRKLYVRYLFKLNLKKLHSINSIKDFYIENILNEIQPSIIIADNHTIYLNKLKKIKPNLITIFYQNNIIYEYDWKRYKKLYQSIKVDYFIAYNNWYAQKFKQIINSNFNLYGSVRNNYFFCKNFKAKKSINFISEFRGKRNYDSFHYFQQEAIKIINEYCIVNNYNLFISLNSNRKDKNISLSEELKFYDNLNINYNYDTDKNSYQSSTNSILTIVLSSNIAIELISRKIPVFLWNIYFNINKKYIYPHYVKKYYIYYNGRTKEILFKKLSKLISEKNISFKNLNKKDKIFYDKNNIHLFKKLYNLKK